MMREFTPYEKEKWFEDGYHFLLYPESEDFIFYGDEWGEAFDAVADCAHKSDYGLSDEFAKHAQIETLDMYYDQMTEAYVDQMRGTPEDEGLPSDEQLQAKAEELGVTVIHSWGEARTDEERKLWDWAMEWRRVHWEEHITRLQTERLERELERVKKNA